MKSLLYGLTFLLSSVSLWAQTVAIDRASGWLESAFVEWKPVNGATSYNVYYSGAGVTNQKIDDQLIRRYGNFFRADVVGLKAGSYTLKIAPVVSGVEGAATTTSSLAVLAHDRSGFAFANGRVPGAYQADGTPKSGAVILYITEQTKNTVSLDITGATANPCVGLQTILDAYKKGKEMRPLIVRMVGQITDLSYMLDGDLVIENNKNASSYLTLEGVGQDAVADGWGVRIKNASNIEVRNIATINVNSGEGDNIGLQQNNDYIWVHNNDFFYGNAGSDGDQAKGDGALDCKKSTYVTFSYNHFWDTGKSNLLGLSEGTTAGLYITYHHNWYDHSDSRHPRVRYYSAHVYNNYYDGNAKYGIGSTLGSSVFAEGNYFRNCKYPMLTSMQGSDVWDEAAQANNYTEMPTFSSENGGTIKAFNNYMEGQKRFVPYGANGYPNSTVDFDAYVASSRTEKIASNIKSAYGGNLYNNFDTDASIMYSYTPDSPENAKTKVTTYAGRVSGGDLKWTFNNAVDDADYAVNAALKAAIVGYKTSLVSIQGDGNGNGGEVPVDPPVSSSSLSSSSSSSPGNIAGDVFHNFTLSGISSTYFSILGNLSTRKGTVVYNGLTLTQCLKMESATQISFLVESAATLTLVLNGDFAGNVLVDGISHTASGGILTVTLEAGTHVIAKGDAANLYYMSITFAEQHTTPHLASAGSSALPIQFDARSNRIYLSPEYQLRQVQVYQVRGTIPVRVRRDANALVLENPRPGVHFIVVTTDRGVFHRTLFLK